MNVGTAHVQVSIVDISEKLGRAACTELQKDYSKKSVLFTVCDVTKREQLVSLLLYLCTKLDSSLYSVKQKMM